MIKVGDKFKDELKEWTISEVYRGAALAFSGNITREFSKQYIYTIMYLEQKQRADEAEEKWEKFKKSVKQLEKDINKWYYDSEDVLQELFDIMIRIERGEEE